MNTFSSRYGAAITALIDTNRTIAIDQGVANQDLLPDLEAATIDTLFDSPVVDHDLAACCLSAVWLWNDFLDESHSISQQIDTADGSFWHGIMHRRECDYSNAKYWFRKVDQHPIFAPLAEQTVALAGGNDRYGLVSDGEWNPYAFIDLCQQAGSGDNALRTYCQQVTRVEWELLFDYCYSRALGNYPS